MFVDPGVKIDGAYYRNFLLSQQLLPAIRQISGEFFIFQQDSAPAHRAHDTINLQGSGRFEALSDWRVGWHTAEPYRWRHQPVA